MARLTTGVSLGPLLADDVPPAAALSAAVGWNQDEADWARLVALHPEGALAARSGAEVVGTATLVVYGSGHHEDLLAWLGMVIVHPGYRGQRIGAALVDAALAELPEDVVVGLDATEFGAPLYERRGFVEVGTIDRWAGVLDVRTSGPAPGLMVRDAVTEDATSLSRFDRSHAGVDRRRLLYRLIREPNTRVLIAETDGQITAYGAVRSGRERRHVGPVVAADEAALLAVMSGLAAATRGEPVFLDAVRVEGRARILEGLGLSAARSLKRMVRPAGARGALLGGQLIAAMGLEWG